MQWLSPLTSDDDGYDKNAANGRGEEEIEAGRQFTKIERNGERGRREGWYIYGGSGKWEEETT